MNILVTGASGFIGRNLVAALKTHGDEHSILACSSTTPFEHIEEFCSSADFVYNLAGVMRPEDPEDFNRVNVDLVKNILHTLESHQNTCPVMLASSIQASLEGRFAGSAYGASKKAAEQAVFEHAETTGARALVYRLTNTFGKGAHPDYCSVVATFCYHIARNEPIRIDDPTALMHLLYVDDLTSELVRGLTGGENRMNEQGVEDGFCHAEPVADITLQDLATMLYTFKDAQDRDEIISPTPGSLKAKMLYTYRWYAYER